MHNLSREQILMRALDKQKLKHDIEMLALKEDYLAIQKEHNKILEEHVELMDSFGLLTPCKN